MSNGTVEKQGVVEGGSTLDSGSAQLRQADASGWTKHVHSRSLFLQVAKGLLAGYGRGDFVRVNTLHVSRIDGRDHIKVSLARQHAVVCVGGCRYRRGIPLLVRPARLRATVDVVADSPGRTGIPA